MVSFQYLEYSLKFCTESKVDNKKYHFRRSFSDCETINNNVLLRLYDKI